MRFRLVPKSLTLNDLFASLFQVIDFLNATKMTKYSLVMTLTPCRVAGGIISVGLHIHAPVQVHLLTYTVGCVRIKLSVSPKRLDKELKLL